MMWRWQEQRVQNPKSLRETAENLIISNLGNMADSITSRFSCGGQLNLVPNSTVSIAYKTAVCHHANEQGSSAKKVKVAKMDKVTWCEFPGANQTDISELLEACTVASFGYKGESVVDKNYRDAFKLDPTDFMTTFQLCDTPILGEIGSINPNYGNLQAELYKLNIYAPGGFFKSHVDTPRSSQMFGSLVVCLPTQFSGGELVVRHQKKEIKYDWSSSASNPLRSLCWAAFFSDIEHEVLPVTEGYRVTLTYNLYYGANLDRPKVDISGNPFFRTLQAMLSNPMFMRQGGILGFNTHYSYTFDMQWADVLVNAKLSEDKMEVITKLKRYPIQQFVKQSSAVQISNLRRVRITDSDIPIILDNISGLPRLKGADYLIFNSAKFLGLPAHIKPVMKDQNTHFYVQNVALLHDDGFKYQLDYDDDSSTERNLKSLFGDNLCQLSKNITWCQQPLYNEPAAAMMCYGNEPHMEVWYKAAVILIGIPRWSDCRQQLVMQSENMHSGSSVKAEDNVMSCFLKFNIDNF